MLRRIPDKFFPKFQKNFHKFLKSKHKR